MSELFEDESEEEIDTIDDYSEVAVEQEPPKAIHPNLDARRKLERMLEEKRLKDELEDFTDY